MGEVATVLSLQGHRPVERARPTLQAAMLRRYMAVNEEIGKGYRRNLHEKMRAARMRPSGCSRTLADAEPETASQLFRQDTLHQLSPINMEEMDDDQSGINHDVSS